MVGNQAIDFTGRPLVSAPDGLQERLGLRTDRVAGAPRSAEARAADGWAQTRYLALMVDNADAAREQGPGKIINAYGKR